MATGTSTIWFRCPNCDRFANHIQEWDYSTHVITYTCTRCGHVSRDYSHVNRGCFITSATLKTLNKHDDCYELQTFRRFRDNWLKANHPEDIIRYYLTAPKIVETIDARNDSKSIYESIWNTHLQKCLMLIEKEENELAYIEYKSMVEELEKL